MADKQDSNLTGLRFAEEESLKVLPVSPVWYGLEPNSYADFGGQLATMARNPINSSRQRKKGTIVDLDASGGFNQDLTMNNLTRLLQGFFFADIREKMTTAPMNAAALPITSVVGATKTYAAASGLATFAVGGLVNATGFAVTANNGLKRVTACTATTVVVNEVIADETTPPAAAALKTVGYQFGSATTAIALNGDLVRLTDSATDMTTLGLILGEWIYVGNPDSATLRFTTNAGGFARISAIAAGYLEFDKTQWLATVETGTGKTIQVFFGSLLKNELASLIKRRTYQVERSLGNDDDGQMSELLIGSCANEITLNITQADKATMDLSFVSLDNEQRTGLQGLKSGARPILVAEEAINTTSDVTRIKLGIASNVDAFVDPLFAYSTELTLTINNNVTPNKAIGVLGGFDTTAGTFEVGGTLTTYFANIQAVQAVRGNTDATIDIVLQRPNAAIIMDIPLMSLGDGRLQVEQDQPIMLGLENNAAESKFANTLTYMTFTYLPTTA